jgi:DNA-binding PadR family transcriptional regulator
MKTLGYAILGLLAQEALSGYDLTQRMKGRVGKLLERAAQPDLPGACPPRRR